MSKKKQKQLAHALHHTGAVTTAFAVTFGSLAIMGMGARLTAEIIEFEPPDRPEPAHDMRHDGPPSHPRHEGGTGGGFGGEFDREPRGHEGPGPDGDHWRGGPPAWHPEEDGMGGTYGGGFEGPHDRPADHDWEQEKKHWKEKRRHEEEWERKHREWEDKPEEWHEAPWEKEEHWDKEKWHEEEKHWDKEPWEKHDDWDKEQWHEEDKHWDKEPWEKHDEWDKEPWEKHKEWDEQPWKQDHWDKEKWEGDYGEGGDFHPAAFDEHRVKQAIEELDWVLEEIRDLSIGHEFYEDVQHVKDYLMDALHGGDAEHVEYKLSRVPEIVREVKEFASDPYNHLDHDEWDDKDEWRPESHDFEGPGGCQSREECDAYCEKEEHHEECWKFGKKHGDHERGDRPHFEDTWHDEDEGWKDEWHDDRGDMGDRLEQERAMMRERMEEEMQMMREQFEEQMQRQREEFERVIHERVSGVLEKILSHLQGMDGQNPEVGDIIHDIENFGAGDNVQDIVSRLRDIRHEDGPGHGDHAAGRIEEFEEMLGMALEFVDEADHRGIDLGEIEGWYDEAATRFESAQTACEGDDHQACKEAMKHAVDALKEMQHLVEERIADGDTELQALVDELFGDHDGHDEEYSEETF